MLSFSFSFSSSSFLTPTVARRATLAASVLVSLSAGTNYAFSAYSPQLAQTLQLSSTSLNAVGIAANYGMYISSPFVGQVIDRIGPRRPLVAAAALLGFGYGLVWHVYRSHTAPSSDPARPSGPITVIVLALGMLSTGFGSSTALSSALGGVARCFGPQNRASVMSLTLAGFGLAAFFWAGLAHILFGDDTASLLLLLSLGTASLILVGAAGFGLAKSVESKNSYQPVATQDLSALDESSDSLNPRPFEVQPTRKPSDYHDCHVDIYGRQLIKTWDFWLIWITMGCCCGTALMIINNIGTIVATLHFHKYHLSSDAAKVPSVAQLQSAQVSLLSVFNCLGRVFAGTVSDTLHSRYGLNRVWWLCWVSGLFLVSQYIGLQVASSLSSVSLLTALTGFAYGNMYGTGPALMLEWFGVNHFATNFGFLNLAPVATSQIFNLAFGQIYDHHHRHQDGHADSPICALGPGCYREAFLISMSACALAMILAGILVYRHQSKNPTSRGRLTTLNDTGNERTCILRSTSPFP